LAAGAAAGVWALLTSGVASRAIASVKTLAILIETFS
jgi:hypothetical protein